MVDTWASLAGEKYIRLTTFRKTGGAVATPVWFTLLDGHVVVYTIATSGKIKRIRNNSHVEIAASDARGAVHGEPMRGIAGIVTPAEEKPLESALNRKYPIKHAFNLLVRLRRSPRAYLEISPA